MDARTRQRTRTTLLLRWSGAFAALLCLGLVSPCLANANDPSSASSSNDRPGSSSDAPARRKPATRGSSEGKDASGKEKSDGPVVFEGGAKPLSRLSLKPKERKDVALRLRQRKSDVAILPFSLAKFNNVANMIRFLRKHLTGAKRSELTRMAWQLTSDATPVPPGLGAIFVPNLIQRSDVTTATYTVYNKSKRPVAITRTGKKSFVYPGEYTVTIGRRANDMLPTYKVVVKKGGITVIRPRWAALIVRVVDERLIQFRGTYDIIHMKSRRAIGTGIGADEILGEKVRPWMLPPGLYMIVRVGDTYLARTNYFTLQVNQGNVTYFRLVIDKNSNQFLGGGVLLRSPTTQQQGAWRWSLQLSGNVLLNYVNNVGGASNGLGFSLAAFFFGRAIYNKNRHFFRTTLNSELGFTLPPRAIFRKGADRLEWQGIYVFRVLSWFGPYARAGFETVMLPDWFQFPDEDAFTRQNVSIYHCQTAICRLQRTVRVTSGEQLQQLQISTIFDPILLKQGVGINVQPLRSPNLDLRFLFGLGFRQDIARDVFQFDPNSDVATRRCKNLDPLNPNPTDLSGCPNAADQENHTSVLLYRRDNSHREGLELALVATGRITRFISYTFEFDFLAPFEFSERATFINFENIEVDGRLTVIFRLSHYASLNFRLRVRRDPTQPTNPADPEGSRWSIDLSNSLAFSLLF